jgi:hypothetical protein
LGVCKAEDSKGGSHMVEIASSMTYNTSTYA